MSKVICWLRGHNWTPVTSEGAVMFTPGIPFPYPSIRYRADPDGKDRACVRCGVVRPSPDPEAVTG